MANDHMAVIEDGDPVASRLTGSCRLDPPANPGSKTDDGYLERSSEIESSCTVLAADCNNQATSSQHQEEEEEDGGGGRQILSAQSLLTGEQPSNETIDELAECDSGPASQSVCRIEIDLGPVGSGDSHHNSTARGSSQQETQMFSAHAHEEQRPPGPTLGDRNHQQQEINNHPSANGGRFFGESSPPKLSFSSRHMREYFESFKSHHQDTRNLYQFFKSARTELVACLLFALISSYALIVCRTSLAEPPTPTPTSTSSASAAAAANRLWSQLISGLIVCLLVASLTQVFGHVSGCHLIPSISLALFIKGHIGRARLASYLAAQLLGALLGVGLLALLTSSQMPPVSSHTDRFRPIGGAGLAHSQQPAQRGFVQLPPTGQKSRRRKRGTASAASSDVGAEKPTNGKSLEWDDFNLNDVDATDSNNNSSSNDNTGPGSETILLSIMEQQQKAKTDAAVSRKLEATNLAAAAAAPSESSAGPKEKTITLSDPMLASTYLHSGGRLPPREPRDQAAKAPSESIGGLAPAAAAKPDADGVIWATGSAGSSNTINDESRVLSSLTRPESFPSEDPSSSPKTATTATSSEQPSLLVAAAAETIGKNSSSLGPVPRKTPLPAAAASASATVIKRSKRNKQRQQHLAASFSSAASAVAEPSNETITSTAPSRGEGARGVSGGGELVTSNMLAWSLPEPIMFADSISQCSKSAGREAMLLANCLSLSNVSQMFVFQLIACSLVVLVYLVNVDPRRTDVGFKSLSIGFGYFVAFAFTVSIITTTLD